MGVPCGTPIPKTCFNCLKAINIPAPAVNPITTECETKLTNLPILANPITSCITPTMKAIKMEYITNSGNCADGSAKCLIAVKDMIEIAVVGPEII